jgi:hypothetical protein
MIVEDPSRNLYLERSELIISIAGSSKAGAAYVPVGSRLSEQKSFI